MIMFHSMLFLPIILSVISIVINYITAYLAFFMYWQEKCGEMVLFKKTSSSLALTEWRSTPVK